MKYRIYRMDEATNKKEYIASVNSIDTAVSFISSLADNYFHCGYLFDYEEI